MRVIELRWRFGFSRTSGVYWAFRCYFSRGVGVMAGVSVFLFSCRVFFAWFFSVLFRFVLVFIFRVLVVGY